MDGVYDDVPPPPPSPPRPDMFPQGQQHFNMPMPQGPAMAGPRHDMGFGDVHRGMGGFDARPRVPPQPIIVDQARSLDDRLPINEKGKVESTYECFRFTPIDTGVPGVSRWERAHKDRLPLTSTQITKLRDDHGADLTKTYNKLGKKQRQIDCLERDHNATEQDGRFEWKKVAIKLDTVADPKGGARIVEAMTVVMKRLPKRVKLGRRQSSAQPSPYAVVSDVRMPRDNRPTHEHGYPMSPGHPQFDRPGMMPGRGSFGAQMPHPGHGAFDKPPSPVSTGFSEESYSVVDVPVGHGPPHGEPAFGGGFGGHHPPGGHGGHGPGPGPQQPPHHGAHGGMHPGAGGYHGGQMPAGGQRPKAKPQHGNGMQPEIVQIAPGHDDGFKEFKEDKPGKGDKGDKKKDKKKPAVHQNNTKVYGLANELSSDSDLDSLFDSNSVFTPDSSVAGDHHDRRYSGANHARKHSSDEREHSRHARKNSSRRNDPSPAPRYREHRRRDNAEDAEYVMVPHKSASRRQPVVETIYPGQQRDMLEDEADRRRRHEQILREEMEAQRNLGKLEGHVEALRQVKEQERMEREARELRDARDARARARKEREEREREREEREAAEYERREAARVPRGYARDLPVRGAGAYHGRGYSGGTRGDFDNDSLYDRDELRYEGRYREDQRHRDEPRYRSDERYPSPAGRYHDRDRDRGYGRRR